MDNIQIIVTADGSHSLLNTALDETYHSRHGATQESVYVFIQKGLEHWLHESKRRSVSVLEIGFGTGLNALLTAQFAKDNNIIIEYTTLEAFPLDESIWSQLNYGNSAGSSALLKEIHRAGWDKPQEIYPAFKLSKCHTSLEKVKLPTEIFDVVYFDAFAPNKQPEMWQLPMLEKVVASMKPQSTFVTYCAKGQLKRDLRSLSLDVETLEGPPGKKEMVRASKR